MPREPIVWELGLTVGALVVFVIWQSVTLKRDRRLTRERKLATKLAEAGTAIAGAAGGSAPTTVPAPDEPDSDAPRQASSLK